MINPINYSTAIREATKPLLAEIERLKMQAHYLALDHKTIEPLLAEIAVKDTAIDTRDAYIGDLAARITERDATIADLRAEIERLKKDNQFLNATVVHDDLRRELRERDATIADLRDQLAAYEGARTAADVQREAEKWQPKWFWARSGMMVSPTYADANEPILPAMTIDNDGRVDAGYPGADGGRDGA